MSKRLENIFSKAKPKTKLIAYFVGCHPTCDKSFEIIKEAIINGVSVIELGFSNSEASAEGPIIKSAQDRVLENNITLDDILNLAKKIREFNQDVGIILMGYISNLYMYSIEKFVKKLKGYDLDGCLVVDAPHELKEENILREELNKSDLALIKLIAPTTTGKRREEIAKLAKGFIYGVNVKGITGVKTANSDSVLKMYKDIKKLTKIPVCSGFGIKTPSDAREVASTGVEGVVVGSTFVDYIEKNLNDTNLSKNLGTIIKEFTNKLN